MRRVKHQIRNSDWRLRQRFVDLLARHKSIFQEGLFVRVFGNILTEASLEIQTSPLIATKTEDGIWKRDGRSFIPEPLRQARLGYTHQQHQGFDAQYRTSTQMVFWPGMKEDLR